MKSNHFQDSIQGHLLVQTNPFFACFLSIP